MMPRSSFSCHESPRETCGRLRLRRLLRRNLTRSSRRRVKPEGGRRNDLGAGLAGRSTRPLAKVFATIQEPGRSRRLLGEPGTSGFGTTRLSSLRVLRVRLRRSSRRLGDMLGTAAHDPQRKSPTGRPHKQRCSWRLGRSYSSCSKGPTSLSIKASPNGVAANIPPSLERFLV